jgi:broad specificity phosphatase PhoE
MMGKWSDTDPALQAWRQTVLATVEKLPADTAVFSHFVAINVIVGLLTGDDRVVVFKPGHASITKLERRAGRLVLAELGAEAATVVT